MSNTTPLLSKPDMSVALSQTRVMASQNKSIQTSSSVSFHLQHLVAGVSGGVTSTLILHPLDLIKIRFQVNEGLGLTQRPQYSGIFNAASCIIRKQGLQGLYQGVAPNIMGTGASWGVYFVSYNALKSRFQNGDAEKTLHPATHMLVASQAGIITLLLTNPILVSKTRLCLQYDEVSPSVNRTQHSSKHYNGMVDCLNKIYRTEGVKGLYRGFVPGLFGISHGAIQFMIYEELKKRYNTRRHLTPNSKLKSGEYITFAAISKIFASAVTYPYQVVRARLQDQHRSYSGIRDVLMQTYKMEGPRGFFKGLSPYLFHVTPNICIVFLMYETISNYRW